MTHLQQQIKDIKKVALRLHIDPDTMGMIWVSSEPAKHYRHRKNQHPNTNRYIKM